jgi:hypothetical protein
MSTTSPAKKGALHQVPSGLSESSGGARNQDINGLLRRDGLAAALDCSLRSIDKLQAEGMPCVYIGRSRRFILEEVIAWLKRKGRRS